MTERRRALLFLNDILQEIDELEAYVALGKQEFLENRTIQKATFFGLQTIGEAVNKLPSEIKEEHPEIPWRDIVDFRNLLAHRYWRIDLNIVWAILEGDKDSLKQLKPVISEIIEKIECE